MKTVEIQVVLTDAAVAEILKAITSSSALLLVMALRISATAASVKTTWISTVFILVLLWMRGSPSPAPHPQENCCASVIVRRCGDCSARDKRRLRRLARVLLFSRRGAPLGAAGRCAARRARHAQLKGGRGTKTAAPAAPFSVRVVYCCRLRSIDTCECRSRV